MGSDPGELLGKGTTVTINGLKARPELNGLTGSIVSYDAAKGRYAVKTPDGEQVLLKQLNLELPPAEESDVQRCGTRTSSAATSSAKSAASRSICASTAPNR